MVIEWQKRPFARPLLFWILGFTLQVCFPLESVSWFFLLPGVVVLFYSLLPVGRGENRMSYDCRWIGGMLFLLFFLFEAIQMTAYREQCLLFSSESMNGLQTWASRQQLWWVHRLDALRLTESGRSLLATLTLGYRQSMEPALNQQFIVAGVVHLLSVSGFHVAVVCGAVSFLLSFLPRTPFFRSLSFLLTVIVLGAYTCISGLSVPAVRSAVMLSVFLTGRFLRRQTDGYNTLAAAAFLMLVYQPFYLFDIGFQLSYLAVFFILYLQPRLERLISLRNPVLAAPWSAITVTLAAQVGTFPLCCYYFGQFSTVFLFTNLLLTFLSGLLLPAALLWMMLPEGFPFIDLLQRGVEWLTNGVLLVVDAFSEIPGAMLPLRFNFLSMAGTYLILLFFLVYMRKRQIKLLLVTLFLLLLWLVYQITMLGRYPK